MRRLVAFPIAVVVLLIVGCSAPAPPVDPTADMVPGAELIYFRPGDPPVRVVQSGECFFTEVYRDSYGQWFLLNEGGIFSTKAAVRCGGGAQP